MMRRAIRSVARVASLSETLTLTSTKSKFIPLRSLSSSSSVPSAVGPKAAELIKTEEKYAAHNYHPLPVVVSQSRGCKMVDADGKEYYDFLSAYSAVNQGHSHPAIANALINQLLDSALTSRAFYNDK